MDQEPNKDYLQRVYQSLLKTGNNISLAELNTSQQPAETFTDTGGLHVASQSQIRQTVKIIQSNGAPKAEASTSKQVRQGINKFNSFASPACMIICYEKESSFLLVFQL